MISLVQGSGMMPYTIGKQALQEFAFWVSLGQACSPTQEPEGHVLVKNTLSLELSGGAVTCLS